VLFSASETGLRDAEHELGNAFGAAAVERLGPDVGRVHDATASDVARVVREQPLVFVRHLAERHAVVNPTTELLMDAAWSGLASGRRGSVAVQVWASGPGSPKPEAVRAGLDSALTRAGFDTVRGGAATTIAVCLIAGQAHVGVTSAADALSDWPGGRVRLARSPDRISRSELKLVELLLLHPVDLGVGTALDLGASPGGWTRVLREQGLEVWAVDPGDLDPRVGDDAGVHHVRSTAGRFLDETTQTFDVVVNDMRMEPERSCDLVVTAARHLRPGGRAVVTLKLPSRTRVSVVASALASLERALEIDFARQLFHNKDEVTVLAHKR
jgi:23S rRNA (cytidine2498-2'-O)-methyltransferase